MLAQAVVHPLALARAARRLLPASPRPGAAAAGLSTTGISDVVGAHLVVTGERFGPYTVTTDPRCSGPAEHTEEPTPVGVGLPDEALCAGAPGLGLGMGPADQQRAGPS